MITYLIIHATTQLPKHLIPISLQPALNTLGIPKLVRRPSPNLILDLLQRPVEALGADLGEEVLDLLERLEIRKLGQADLDHAVDKNGVAAELAVELVPVVADVGPEKRASDAVTGQVARENVHVGAGNRVSGVGGRRSVEEEGEEDVLDEGLVGDLAESLEANLLAVDGGGGEPLVLDSSNGVGGVPLNGSTVDGETEIRRNGSTGRVGAPGVPALESLINNLLVRVGDSSEEKTLAEERDVVVLAVLGFPANLLESLVNKLQSELLEALLDLLIIAEDGLEGVDRVQSLAKNTVVGLVLQALDERQQSGSGGVASKRKIGRGTGDEDLVLGSKMSKLSAQSLETRLGVVDAVEAGGVGIELVKVLADAVDGGLLGLERQRLNILGANLALEGQGNPPGGLVILRLDIAGRKEAGLLN